MTQREANLKIPADSVEAQVKRSSVNQQSYQTSFRTEIFSSDTGQPEQQNLQEFRQLSV